MGCDAWGHGGPHTGRFVRSPGESLVAVSGAQLSHLGPERPVPARGCLRIPRPASGCSVAPVRETGSLSFTSPAGLLAAVRRGRRTTLVAPARRARNAH